MTIIAIKASILLLLSTVAIDHDQHHRAPDSSDIEVTWELISNAYSDEVKAKAEFTIENNGDFTLTEDNWALYYNQRPTRTLISSSGTPPAEVEWINGNWWTLYPLAGFELGEGEKATITYEVAGWWIKEESDAPMGLYFVIYDDDGNEEDIVSVTNYEVKPFVRPEQMTRHRNDPLPLPSPEQRYEVGASMERLGDEDLHSIIPTPANIEVSGEHVTLNEPMDILYDEELRHEAYYLAEQLQTLTGLSFHPKAGGESSSNSILLAMASAGGNDVGEEAYQLDIAADKSITIQGGDRAGVFYGIQSLIGLIPIDDLLNDSDGITLEVTSIEDAPRFPYRGLLVDVARNFQSQEAIFKVLDIMAYYKLNTLHFYLTDDEGWRVEIEGLPELTDIGGQRKHTSNEVAALPPAYGSGPYPYAEGTHGSGYYTRAEFVEILKYAADRHINVIPSINLPAHARAAVKAMEARYERLMEEGDEEAANEFRLIDPDDTSEYVSAQRYTDNVANVARESVYHFYETVINGLSDMYDEADAPFEIMHTGGDEVPVGAWTESPMAEDLLEDLPEITDPHNLQAYFSRRTFDMLLERNLNVGGWEEVAQERDEGGDFVPNPEFADGDVITYVWRNQSGTRDLAYSLANMGYPVVLAHRSNFYFDLSYNNHPREPGHYSAGFINTRDAWQYAPYDIYKTTLRTRMGRKIDVEKEHEGYERLEPEARENILGLQAQVWSETVLGQEMLEYYLLPRLAGFSESAWTSERAFETIENREEREIEMQRAWNRFANTLGQKELPRLSVLSGGFNYRIPKPGAVINDGVLNANVKYPGLEIRYTTNGEKPTLDSTEYDGPIEVSGPVVIKAFDASGRHSRAVTIE